MSSDHTGSLDLGRLRRTCATCGLVQLCLPAGVDEEGLKRLDDVVQSRRPLERGQSIYESGAEFQSLFVVRSGSFKTFVTTEEGETQILGFHLPGEIMGFDAISSNRHTCSAEALERASVCEVPFAHVSQVSAQVPELQRQLMRVISLEVVRDHEHLVMMGRRQAQQRLAIFLKSVADRYRRLRRDPGNLTLAMSRYEIANYLGLVVETVSRLFGKFQQMGVLQVERKHVRVLDFDKLDALSGEAPEPCEQEERKFRA